MKYTLKNRPQYPEKTGVTDYIRACVAYDDWLEGFEKELRDMIQTRPLVPPTKSDKVAILVIKEILGEVEECPLNKGYDNEEIRDWFANFVKLFYSFKKDFEGKVAIDRKTLEHEIIPNLIDDKLVEKLKKLLKV